MENEDETLLRAIRVAMAEQASGGAAMEYLNAAKAARGGWRRFLRVWKGASGEPHVSFVCLQALQVAADRFSANPEPDAWPELRVLTLSWVRSHSVAGSLSQVPAFLRTKIAVIFALLLQSCFPQQWASPVSDLAAVVQDGSTARFALRSLMMLIEEVMVYSAGRKEAEVVRNSEVKRALKETGESARIVDLLLNILASAIKAQDDELLAIQVED